MGAGAALLTAAAPAWSAAAGELADIERSLGGRLGVWAIEVGANRSLAWRSGERFPMCSSFKALLAAAVLERVDHGALTLDRRIAYGEADLLEYAPTTRARVSEGGMSVLDLCEAAVELSDNTAANLLLRLVDGPAGLTTRLRAWGDPATRLDRDEPTLNSSIPGDPRDTTTPQAMAGSIGRVVLGDVLAPESRARLRVWMIACKTGLAKLRAGLPTGAVVGDKTGNNGHDTEGDVAFVEIGGRTLLVAAYLTLARVDQKAQDAAIAEVARRVSAHFGLAHD
jgi:beta-lactamase class A